MVVITRNSAAKNKKDSTLADRVWTPIQDYVETVRETAHDNVTSLWCGGAKKTADKDLDPEMEELNGIIYKLHNYRRAMSVFLIASTLGFYLTYWDWWIYGIITLSSGLVNLAYWPKYAVWRLATSAIIVFGVLESLFLAYTFNYLQEVPMLDSATHVFKAVPEGIFMTFVSFATMLSIACRVFSAKYDAFSHFIRSLLLSAMFMVCFYVFAHGLLYVLGLLPNPAINALFGWRKALAVHRDNTPDPFQRTDL